MSHRALGPQWGDFHWARLTLDSPESYPVASRIKGRTETRSPDRSTAREIVQDSLWERVGPSNPAARLDQAISELQGPYKRRRGGRFTPEVHGDLPGRN